MKYQKLLNKNSHFTVFSASQLSQMFDKSLVRGLQHDSCQHHINSYNGFLGVLVLNYLGRQDENINKKLSKTYVSAYRFSKNIGKSLNEILDVEDQGRNLVILGGEGDNKDYYISVNDLHNLCDDGEEIINSANTNDDRERLVLEYQRTKNEKIMNKIIRLSEDHINAIVHDIGIFPHDPAFDEEDLEITGYMGLLYAIQTFNKEKNASFNTWAHSCIKWKMWNEFKNCAKLKYHDLERVLELRKFTKEYNELYEKDPTPEECKKELIRKGHSEGVVNSFMEVFRNSEQFSLNMTKQGEEIHLFEVIPNKLARDPLDIIIQAECRDLWMKDISGIKDKQRKGLAEDFFINGYTLEETGERNGITRERVRQITEEMMNRPEYLRNIKNYYGISGEVVLHL